MESLIFALVSLIFLVPILFTLHLGLKAKGKFIVIVVSFFVSIMGILAKNTFSLWQSGLMVVLLAVLAAYILDKRMGSSIYIHTRSNKKVEMVEYKAVSEKRSELEESEQILPDSLPNLMEVNQTKMETIEKEELKPEPYVEKIEFKHDDSPDKEKVNTNNMDFSMDEGIEEDLSFLLNRDIRDEDAVLTLPNNDSVQSLEMDYMEEIERMLETEHDMEEWVEGKEFKQHHKTDVLTMEPKDHEQSIIQVSQNESSSLSEEEVELEELHFNGGENHQNDLSSRNGMESTIDSTWEEDEIQPLQFDHVTDSQHPTQKEVGIIKKKIDK